MCIIAIKPEGHTIPDSIIKTMWNGNSHGAGFMYADRGRVKIVKGFMSLVSFQKALAKHNHRKLVMHFRIKTHGDVSPDLTHPFWVQKNGVAMVHNGIIWDYAKKATNTESDSLLYARHFGRRFQQPMAALADATINAAIAQEIGYSKLVFMDGNGEVVIVNEKLGTWADGVWYSNSGYKEFSWGSYTGRYGASVAGDDDDWSYYGSQVATSNYVTGQYGAGYQAVLNAREDERELAIKRAQREAEYEKLFAEFGMDEDEGGPTEECDDDSGVTARPIGFLPASSRAQEVSFESLEVEDEDDADIDAVYQGF